MPKKSIAAADNPRRDLLIDDSARRTRLPPVSDSTDAHRLGCARRIYISVKLKTILFLQLNFNERQYVIRFIFLIRRKEEPELLIDFLIE